MSVFLNRGGGVSIFRAGLFVAIVGLVIIVSGFVLLEFERSARRSPINLALYPNAELIHLDEYSSTGRERGFSVPGSDAETVQAVLNHYQGEMDDYYDNNPNDPNREQCVRNPISGGNFPDYTPGIGRIPYEYRCEFEDDSDLGGQRLTIVRIYPGQRNDLDPNARNFEDSTLIIYNEVWVN